VLAGGLLHTK